MDWNEWTRTDEYREGWKHFAARLQGVFGEANGARRPYALPHHGKVVWMRAEGPLDGVRLVAAFVATPGGGAPPELNLNVWTIDRPEFDPLPKRLLAAPAFSWEGRALHRVAPYRNPAYEASVHPTKLRGINHRRRVDDLPVGPAGLQALAEIVESFCVYVRKVLAGESVLTAPPAPSPLGAAPAPALWQEAEDDLSAYVASLDTRPLEESERSALVKQRIGQGWFREQLAQRWKRCPLTNCSVPQLLVASHIVPWAQCQSADERWSVDNGLLLAPAPDRLFDRGLISFDDSGRMLVKSEQVSPQELVWLGLDAHRRINSSQVTPGMRGFFQRHRKLFGFSE